MDFWFRRGVSDEHILQGSVRSEQRSLSQKDMPPCGLRRFWVLASLLLGHSPTAGDAPSSRLARTENRRNKRGRIYEMEYLAARSKTSRSARQRAACKISRKSACFVVRGFTTVWRTSRQAE